jgi:hypothetical protein
MKKILNPWTCLLNIVPSKSRYAVWTPNGFCMSNTETGKKKNKRFIGIQLKELGQTT